MTELLTREKEFVKLNQKLDQWAAVALEQQQHLQEKLQHHANKEIDETMTPRKSNEKSEQRFQTYTKTKGQSTLIKKRIGPGAIGANGTGDADSDLINNFKEKNGTALPEHHNVIHSSTYTRTSKSSKPISTPVSSNGRTNERPPQFPSNTITVSHKDSASSTSYRKQKVENLLRTPRSSGNSSRISTIRTPFTVKYRNPNFVESPSLEILVKDEEAQLRQNQTPDHSDIDIPLKPKISVVQRGGLKSQISTDGLIKFLKAKICILEEDRERLADDVTLQKERLEKTLERQKRAEQQRDQAVQRQNALTEQLNKFEVQLEESTRCLRERSAEHVTQQKEFEMVKRDLKVLTQTNSNLEKRLYRANEEIDNIKNTMALMKAGERDLKDKLRAESESKDKQIKSLKKQRADLLNAYKKQLFLIDNLKRQNVCMEQSKMVSFVEKEFTKVLEWNKEPKSLLELE